MGHANLVMALNYNALATFHSAQEEMERLQVEAEITAEAKLKSTAEGAEEAKVA
jgi:hypothetical protein